MQFAGQAFSLDSFIAKLSQSCLYEKVMIQASHLYNIKPYKLQQLTPQQVRMLYLKLQYKFEKSSERVDDGWRENELRVFMWIVMGYMFLQKKVIKQLEDKDWLFFMRLFLGKKRELLEFYVLSVQKQEKKKFVFWECEESALFHGIVMRQKKKRKNIEPKWSQYALALFMESNKTYLKTPKQCREYWLNHLNPQIKKNSWAPEEDRKLIQTIAEVGKKWARVAKHLNGRTENMVKNRYTSLTKIYVKHTRVEKSSYPSEQHFIQELQNWLEKTFVPSSFSPSLELDHDHTPLPSIDLVEDWLDKELFDEVDQHHQVRMKDPLSQFIIS